MPWSLFVKILDELAALRFNGWIAFHNFNEPLANPRLFQELEEAKVRLPSCPTSLFSNGDLLSATFLERLRDVGLGYLRVTLYPSAQEAERGEAPSLSRIENWLNIKQLKSFTVWAPTKVRQGTALLGDLGDLRLEVISPDLRTYNWRGGTALVIAGTPRSLPCYMTLHSASIDFRGRMKMCCNVFPEAPSHESYIIGNLDESSFEELWDSEAMNQYRITHSQADWRLSAICNGCTQHLPPEQLRMYIGRR